jgi:hypothetical protein
MKAETAPEEASHLSAVPSLATVGGAADAVWWQREGLARYPAAFPGPPDACRRRETH